MASRSAPGSDPDRRCVCNPSIEAERNLPLADGGVNSVFSKRSRPITTAATPTYPSFSRDRPCRGADGEVHSPLLGRLLERVSMVVCLHWWALAIRQFGHDFTTTMPRRVSEREMSAIDDTVSRARLKESAT
jgi:hypothetical protein